MKRKSKQVALDYDNFDLIDGSHPWIDAVPDSCVLYKARIIKKGKVTYFNYELAQKMGLIPSSHPKKMNSALEKKILDTFNIRIINEYDIQNKRKFRKDTIKQNKYMATRYLQLQHNNKQGKTSGDGRCIWNGFVKHRGKSWDISSRGTGVTKLAPGSVIADKPLKTGDESVGYSCGLLEIDEMYGAVIISELFNQHHINTERILAIIDNGKGLGIGVRAAPNLFRPAHLFSFIKQNDLINLKKAVDYLIDRQNQNGEWPFAFNNKDKYKLALNNLCTDFAKFAARLEADYIFAWLDWDGDNVLLNAGIIDYGSVRQFGLRHDKYRFDDVERWSTTLNEQRLKVRSILQVFAQIMNALTTNHKKNLKHFSNHKILQSFDEQFEFHCAKYKLHNLGFSKKDQEHLVLNHKDKVNNFLDIFTYFETSKTKSKNRKVDDGKNHAAIFSMRDLLRELPNLLLEQSIEEYVEPAVLFEIMLASTASRRDRIMSLKQEQKLLELQDAYKILIFASKKSKTYKRTLSDLNKRSQVINRADRFTGNAIAHCTDELIAAHKRGLPTTEIQNVIDDFIKSQILLPSKALDDPRQVLKRKSKKSRKILSQLLTLVEDYKDDI